MNRILLALVLVTSSAMAQTSYDAGQDAAISGFGKALTQSRATDAGQDAALSGLGKALTANGQKDAALEARLAALEAIFAGGGGTTSAVDGNVATKDWVNSRFQSRSRGSLADIYVTLGIYTERKDAADRVRAVLADCGAKVDEDRFRAVLLDAVNQLRYQMFRRAEEAGRDGANAIRSELQVMVEDVDRKFAGFGLMIADYSEAMERGAQVVDDASDLLSREGVMSVFTEALHSSKTISTLQVQVAANRRRIEAAERNFRELSRVSDRLSAHVKLPDLPAPATTP